MSHRVVLSLGKRERESNIESIEASIGDSFLSRLFFYNDSSNASLTSNDRTSVFPEMRKSLLRQSEQIPGIILEKKINFFRLRVPIMIVTLNYRQIQIGCVSLERATRVTARCCPVLTGSQCQGREGVAEIGAWNYDAHTPNFPSLSEVRDRSYRAAPFLLFLLEDPPCVSYHPWVHPYPRSSLRCRVSALPARVPLFSLHPLL